MAMADILWRRVYGEVGAKGGNFSRGDARSERNWCEGAGEIRGEAGSGFTRSGEAGVPLEDGISSDAGAADAGVSEMDSGRAHADAGDCGRDRAAFSREWSGNSLAAR